ncbi:MAG: type II secretion system GspH family protein [Actinobacteria bacterium]|nr:type II secretion system GspH family protein [Actinomycetota bacterium]
MEKKLPPFTNKRGFTLIELLVVITIIAILSMVAVVTYAGVQKQARDSKRKQDIQAMQKALEAHYNDTSCGAVPTSAQPYCQITDTTATVLFANGSIPAYPSNPDGTSAYSGIPTSAGSNFTLCAKLENSTGNYSDLGSTAVSGNSGSYFCLKSQQ